MAADISNLGFEVFERLAEYQDALQRRLEKAKNALEAASIPYAVIGGTAVAAWVSSVDPSAVRTTRDVDILLSRHRLPAAIQAMQAAGFVYRHVASIDMFLDHAGAPAREAVHVLFAGEKVRPDYHSAAPQETETVLSHKGYSVITLEALVRMKLTSYRLKDQVHLQDMISVGLLDATWPSKYQDPLCERLQRILDNPEM